MVAGLTNDFDGAWYAVFGAQLGGEGIVLLRNGFILGCDDQYFYEGRYVLDDVGGFRALVKVSHYAGDRALSIFGEFGPFATLESFHAELRGGPGLERYIAAQRGRHRRPRQEARRRTDTDPSRSGPSPPSMRFRVEFEAFSRQ
jgi:hypothetical protein